MTALCEIIPSATDPTKAKLRFTLHPGQSEAFESKKRFILVLAGTQSGKTALGPLWLRKEIQERGPGDYLVVTPTYPLLVKKALPEFLHLFKTRLKLGEYQSQQKIFTFSDGGCRRLFGSVKSDVPTQVFFAHAQDPESLESATAKAAWLDEAGQKKFRLGSWEAIQRRLSIHEGRALLTTTPYDLGWLKQMLWDPWKAAGQNHPFIDVIRFDSIENPAFPRKEFERARETLPRWRFDLFYRAIFTRPAGLIYTSFDESRHKCPRFDIPPDWRRFIGLDFGGVNTAAVFFAEERVAGKPTGRLIGYREYKAGERSAAEHVYHLMKGEPRIPICAGGSKSESQWRREFAAGGTVNGHRVPGLPIHGPAQSDIEVGINRVFAAFALNKILIFDDLNGLLDELGSYSRELDDTGNPTEKIDNPHDFHSADALRYLLNYLQLDKPQPTCNGSFVARPGLRNL